MKQHEIVHFRLEDMNNEEWSKQPKSNDSRKIIVLWLVNLQTKTTLALTFLFLKSPYNIAALNNTIVSLINLERPQRTRHTADPEKTVLMEHFYS